jgi:hypothetical protein
MIRSSRLLLRTRRHTSSTLTIWARRWNAWGRMCWHVKTRSPRWLLSTRSKSSRSLRRWSNSLPLLSGLLPRMRIFRSSGTFQKDSKASAKRYKTNSIAWKLKLTLWIIHTIREYLTWKQFSLLSWHSRWAIRVSKRQSRRIFILSSLKILMKSYCK